MMRNRLIFILPLLLTILSVKGQNQFILKKDLQADWLVYDANQYRKFDNADKPTTIYFHVDASVYKKDHLLLSASAPFSVLLNNTVLLDQVRQATLPIDSLEKLQASPMLFITIRQEVTVTRGEVTTQIASAALFSLDKQSDSYLRGKESFRDFAITGILVIIIFLVSIIRLNPGLSSDYFSVFKIFSIRESEDDHYYYRVTSATILFYVFTSLMIGLFILVINRFVAGAVAGVELSLTATYWTIMFLWLKISFYILALLFAKISIIYLTSILFGIREIAGYHFFNFVRLLLVSIGILALVLIFYFISHGQREGFYNFFYATVPWILGAWIMLSFFKLANRVHHSAFHLFSYICATELIPFFLIIEVLNK